LIWEEHFGDFKKAERFVRIRLKEKAWRSILGLVCSTRYVLLVWSVQWCYRLDQLQLLYIKIQARERRKRNVFEAISLEDFVIITYFFTLV